jgi:hypothetical protein
MHEDDDDDRIEAAMRLVRLDPRAAAAVFHGISDDDGPHRRHPCEGR